jgi:hypothetical protein
MPAQGSPVETQNPTHWNLIGRIMTVPLPSCVIAQQYSSPTLVSLRFHSRNKKFGAPLENVVYQMSLL